MIQDNDENKDSNQKDSKKDESAQTSNLLKETEQKAKKVESDTLNFSDASKKPDKEKGK